MFQFKRFTNYIKYDLRINGKTYLLSLLALFAALVIIDYILLLDRRVRFGRNQFEPIMAVGLIMAGIFAVGGAFPAFRNKQKTINFLCLPVSRLEKYLWELFLRIPFFFFLFMGVFWLAFHSAKAIYFITRPQDRLVIEEFKFLEIYVNLNPEAELFAYLGTLSLGALLFSGAAFFKKYAHLKTLLSFSLLLFGLFVFMVTLSHIFFPYMLNNVLEIDFFMYNSLFDISSGVLTFLTITILSSLFFLPLAYYLLKEKEI
ncbi:hypothetical protein [Sediminicola luteus]|uniref:Uncharacterized protein n=1 Tax=Sediminicola luteus TaxID=319238 RepID=A0A2A4G5T8_9FLAO|nr:hypothetical protein [Sediminicola luteus]PCE63346.1 hypothetical protein B7P33_14095 [Sediminicola luteus]